MSFLNLRHRLRLEGVQPVEEVHQHVQSFQLAGLYHFAHFCTLSRIILKVEIPPLECDGVVEEELRSLLELLRNSVLGEVPREGTRNIGEQEGNIVDHGVGKDSGESGECIVGTNSDTWDGAIGEDKNGINRLDVVLDLSRNILPVDLVLPNPASIRQPRCVKDADLGRGYAYSSYKIVLALTNMPLQLVNS